MDCASWGKCADCMTKWCRSIEGLQVSTGFVIPISRYWFFLNCRLNRNRAQQLFFAVLHQRWTALHKSCLSTRWFCVAIFWHLYGSAPAALSIATAASMQSQKCTAAVNGKQHSWNLSASLVAVLISHKSNAVLTSSVSYGLIFRGTLVLLIARITVRTDTL